MKRRDALKTISLGMGYTISAGALASLATACKTESKVTWEPTFFSKNEAKAIEELIEVILPETDTPGAREVGVTPLVDILLKDVYKEKDQKKFQKGMKVFLEKFGGEKDAARASSTQMTSVLQDTLASMSKERNETQNALLSKKEEALEEGEKDNYYLYKFIYSLKSLAISGYFSSELIGTKHLVYDPVPGPYKGCIPLSDVGNNYSL